MIDSATIRKTFCEEAIRTVMLIDDEFPTYADLQARNVEPNPESGTVVKPHWQFERAKALYETFKGKTLLCDIENNPARLDHPHIERVRKSDLIILDFNLRGESDSTDSIGLLKTLADSPHFNLVIVYTKDPLDRVWMEVAANLRSGWSSAKDLLEGNEVANEARTDFLEKHRDYEIDEAVIAGFILLGRKLFSRDVVKDLKADLKEAKVPPAEQTDIMEALINDQIIRTLGVRPGGEQKSINGNFSDKEVRWIHCGTVFVTFMQKKDESDDAAHMYGLLEKALVDWNPNVLQVFLSQIQNTLELKALAYDKRIFESEELQAGWIYNALTDLLEKDDPAEGVRQVVEKLYARVLNTIGGNLMYEHKACEEGVQLFKSYLEGEPSKKDFAERMQQAIELSRNTKPLDKLNVLHALNSYLSTEPFRDDFITNGTLFFEERNEGEGDWWVCTSPACDMVPRPLHDEFSYNHSLFPFIPMTALRLQSTGKASLDTATQGRTIFVKHGDTQRCFHAFNPDTHQPRSAMFMLSTTPVRDHKFEAYALAINDAKEATTTKKTFVIGGQLRSDYASRLLQQVGHHSSRIGVDFVDSIPRKEDKASKKDKPTAS